MARHHARAAQRLTSAGVDGAARDARLLLAQALGIEPLDVILRETDSVDAAGLAAFEALVKRREAAEPVSRIRGWREFHGHRFAITPDVLDPRPETELLGRARAQALAPRRPRDRPWCRVWLHPAVRFSGPRRRNWHRR
jgi:methylase of polypeptide subunit release factors